MIYIIKAIFQVKFIKDFEEESDITGVNKLQKNHTKHNVRMTKLSLVLTSLAQ